MYAFSVILPLTWYSFGSCTYSCPFPRGLRFIFFPCSKSPATKGFTSALRHCSSPNRIWFCSVREQKKKSPDGVYCSSCYGCCTTPVLHHTGNFLCVADGVQEEKSTQEKQALLFPCPPPPHPHPGLHFFSPVRT